MNTALEVLRELNQIHPLGDYVYDIREREGLGWTGPKVTAWGKACDRIRQLLDRPDEELEFDHERVLRENGAKIVYSDKITDSMGRVHDDPFPGYNLVWKHTISFVGLDERRVRIAAGLYIYLILSGISVSLAHRLATSYAFLLPEDET